MPNLSLARSAEDAAAAFLGQEGYRILERNYRTKLGEIDIIAKDKDVICFIEVKCRSSVRKGLPAEAINAAKRIHLYNTATLYLKAHKLLERKARFDVVSVLMDEGATKINIIRNAFDV